MDSPGADVEEMEESCNSEDSEKYCDIEIGETDQLDCEATNDVEATETDAKGDDDEAKVDEEAPMKIARNPADPTLEERAKHDATHVPFRAWSRN